MLRARVVLTTRGENAWRAGRDLDLGGLIGEVQSPPLRKLGVFEDRATYTANADSPEQDAQYQQLRALLEPVLYLAFREQMGDVIDLSQSRGII